MRKGKSSGTGLHNWCVTETDLDFRVSPPALHCPQKSLTKVGSEVHSEKAKKFSVPKDGIRKKRYGRCPFLNWLGLLFMVSDRKPMRYVRPKRETLERMPESQDGKELPWLGRHMWNQGLKQL